MIKYVGVNDRITKLFEGQFIIPEGISYNSYVILDDKVVVMDSVDVKFADLWLANIDAALDGKNVDYLIVDHMEPDHSASLDKFVLKYPNAVLVGNNKTFNMLNNFFPNLKYQSLVVNDGDELDLGHDKLKFVMTPMVHWPEVMMSYLKNEKVLFSADAFGKFGALDFDDPEGWACEARRYYFGIVGKFGAFVQKALQKLSAFEINAIYPLHGPVLDDNLSYYLGLYDTWSKYEPEKKGTVIFSASVYGHTHKACEELYDRLEGTKELMDLLDEDIYECVESAFEYSKIVLSSITYNSGIFPKVEEFINLLLERGYKNRTIAIIENGSWGPMARKQIVAKFENVDVTILDEKVTLKSALNAESLKEIEVLADKLNSIE